MPGTDISVKLLVFWLFYCFKGVEWTSTSKQGFVTISSLSFFSVGLMLMSGVAYFAGDWRILHLVFSSPLILLLLAGYWYVNPSSDYLKYITVNHVYHVTLTFRATSSDRPIPFDLNHLTQRKAVS